MDAADLGWLDAQRRRYFPPERNVLAAHLTLFHHLPPARLPELDRLVATICRDKAPVARIDRLMSLGRGVAYAVDSPALLEMRTLIAEHFDADLVAQDRQRPRLHVTIQNKVAPAVARALLDQLAVDFRPRPLRIVGIGGWHYRGGPWESAFARRFRRP